MRLNIKLCGTIKVVPFHYQHNLISAVHRWLPNNDIHDNISLYSISWLRGGKATNSGLHFPQGANWFISFHELVHLKELLGNMLKSPNVSFGMKVEDVTIEETPQFRSQHRFIAASPILVREYIDGKADHLTYSDKKADELLTNTLNSKLRAAGITDKTATIQFDRTYPKAKTKLVDINGIKNKANFCPVLIQGDPEAISFAWNTGIGHSTGSTFGAVC